MGFNVLAKLSQVDNILIIRLIAISLYQILFLDIKDIDYKLDKKYIYEGGI